MDQPHAEIFLTSRADIQVSWVYAKGERIGRVEEENGVGKCQVKNMMRTQGGKREGGEDVGSETERRRNRPVN